MTDRQIPAIVHSKVDNPNAQDKATQEGMPSFSVDDLQGRTFLMKKQEDGQRFRAHVVKLIEEHNKALEEDPIRQTVHDTYWQRRPR